MSFTDNQRVRFVRGPLGVLDDNGQVGDERVNKGDYGNIIALPAPMDEGWLMVRVGTGLVPVHPSMIEAAPINEERE